jgi:hypothetical protein
MLVGTCSAALTPECVRAVGVRVWPGACQLTVLLPKVTAAVSIANLRENARLALTLAEIPTHRTVQIKGRVLAIRDGDEDDRALANHYRAMLVDEYAHIGQTAANTSRLSVWPCHAIDLDIEVVFAQTPGPHAGEKMPLASMMVVRP